MRYVLVKSRHEHPDIDSLPALFDSIEDNQIFDFDYHKKVIHKHLRTHEKKDPLVLYVTGMTPLLVSVLNYCSLFNISIVLYHFDISIKKYVAQSVV